MTTIILQVVVLAPILAIGVSRSNNNKFLEQKRHYLSHNGYWFLFLSLLFFFVAVAVAVFHTREAVRSTGGWPYPADLSTGAVHGRRAVHGRGALA